MVSLVSASAPSRLFEPAIPAPAAIDLTENGRFVLESRYLRKGPDGKPIETPEQLIRRVAHTIAAPEEAYQRDVQSAEDTFYAIIASLRFIPNSPTFTGAGTGLGQLAACFVLPIADDLGSSPDGIFQVLRHAVLIQQSGGGNGFAFSRLRPKGDTVSSSGGQATGPVGFLQAYDSAFGIISKGGARRGAAMAALRVDHPDIEEFIACKTQEGRITNFNLSVAITDAFMKAVKNDEEFGLINPRDGSVCRTVRARALFDTIVTHAHHNGEPGALFLDAANRSNPVPQLYTLEGSNPCGEQWLGPYESCCLGSINLARHIDSAGAIDWARLQETAVVAVRFLDNVIDANRYVPAVPQIREVALQTRRIGVGIMGLADLCYRSGVPYGSPDALDLSGQVMEFIRFHAMRTSIELASERGPFPAIEGSIYDCANFRWTPPVPLEPYSRDWGRPALNWTEIAAGVRAHGIRNAATTTVAPTGTIGSVAGCEGYGCEPVFALAYTRTVRQLSGDESSAHLAYRSPLFEAALAQAGLDEAPRQQIWDRITVNGSCADVAEVPEEIRKAFVVARDIKAEDHVRMQASLQRFVDNSISKTINFPESATVQDVARAYELSWELGCKGLTVYVEGSRKQAVLETKQAQAEQSRPVGQAAGQAAQAAAGAGKPVSPPQQPLVRQRPPALSGKTHRRSTFLGTAFITVNEDAKGEPFEVFLNVGFGGTQTATFAESMGRLISLILRLPSPMSPRERVKAVVEQIEGIGGGRHVGFGPKRVSSLPNCVATALTEHFGLEESAEPAHAGDLCPRCGNATLIRIEGCKKCYECDYSEC